VLLSVKGNKHYIVIITWIGSRQRVGKHFLQRATLKTLLLPGAA